MTKFVIIVLLSLYCIPLCSCFFGIFDFCISRIADRFCELTNGAPVIQCAKENGLDRALKIFQVCFTSAHEKELTFEEKLQTLCKLDPQEWKVYKSCFNNGMWLQNGRDRKTFKRTDECIRKQEAKEGKTCE